MATSDTESSARVGELVPFVPRLTLEWLKKSLELRWLEVEGTLAFIDISGFTAMSEKLSSSGRAGAEEVTEVMNATFGTLLEVAYAEGGGLLKFGGDALLLLYDGEDHAQRAARAAFEMRRTLRAIGRPRTSAGAVQLKMHAGIHSGTFQFFLVGESHRELLVTGPAASRTVEMEAASEAGEILVSPETAARLDPSTLGEQKGPGRLLQVAPDVRGTLEPLPDPEGIPVQLAVPAPLRAQLLEVGPLEGEHRHAAVAFVRYAGVDEIIATEGPASAAEAIDVLAQTIQAAADEYNVTFLESDVDRDGGRIILVSGAPQTFGHDEERLLRTLRTAVDAGLPLPVHVGVSEGKVFTGQVGAPFRRTYTILGDTAALAARLMSRAGEDEIWVTASAYERGGSRFESTELEPFQVKGKTEPVHAVVLGELLPEAERAFAEEASRDDKLPFVDRERERAVLGASVAPVRMGFGTMVELIGEPGIGKSRLADELRESCADMKQITLRCDQYESSTPYHPFRPFLRSSLGVQLNGGGAHNRDVISERLATLDPELVPWAPLLAAPLDVEIDTTPEVDDLDPSFRRARLHGVVGSVLGKLLDSPTLLVFEDVHWMDDASSDLLRHIGTQLPTRPWLACTTRRPEGDGFLATEGTPPLPALTLRLEPLPADDAKTLIRAAAGERSLSDEELAAIFERGDGNPLFLQELASPDEGEAAEQMPDTVEELVATRIDKLAPGDRALLRWASVLGVAFSGAVIADVLEGDPTAASDSEAWDRLAEFVERDPHVPGGFRFRHALIRDGAYGGLSYKRRRELHGRVAEVIESREGVAAEESAELLSLHFHRAERWPETWNYALAAARRAQEKWANLDAVEFYRRALDAAKHVSTLESKEVAGAWEALADCLRMTGEAIDATAALAAARKLLAADTPRQIVLMRKEGLLRDDMGRYSDAVRWYRRGLKAADALADEGERVRLRVQLEAALGQVRFRQGAYEECIRSFRAVVADASPALDGEALAHAYLMLHAVQTQLGVPERADFRGLALALYEEMGDLNGQAVALNNLGAEAYFDGSWAKALDLYERSRELCRRIGDVTNAALATNNIAEILSDQGRLGEAETMFEEVVRDCEPLGHRLWSTMAKANLGRAAARGGRFDEARSLLEEAVAEMREMGAEGLVLETELRLGELDALGGGRGGAVLERVAAVQDDEQALAEAASLRAFAQRLRAAGLAQLGRRDEAVTALEDSVRLSRDGNVPFELAQSLDLLGALGDADAAAESASLLQRLEIEQLARPPLG